MEAQIFSKAEWLNVEQNNGYGRSPIPCLRDAEIENLIVKWQALSPDQRGKAAAGIAEDQRFTLLAFAERMATAAVRMKDPSRIQLGLIALGLDGWRSDWRDNATILCLHYDAAKRLDVEPIELFRSAGSLLSEKVNASFSSYLDRSEDDKSLDSMGYTTDHDKGGFRYIRNW